MRELSEVKHPASANLRLFVRSKGKRLYSTHSSRFTTISSATMPNIVMIATYTFLFSVISRILCCYVHCPVQSSNCAGIGGGPGRSACCSCHQGDEGSSSVIERIWEAHSALFTTCIQPSLTKWRSVPTCRVTT